MIIDKIHADYTKYRTKRGTYLKPQIACLTDLRLQCAAENFINEITANLYYPSYRSKTETGIVYYLYCSTIASRTIKAYIDGLSLGYAIGKQ